MSAVATPTRRPSSRFDAFVWISAGIHLAVLLTVIAASLGGRKEKPKVVSFDLMDVAPRGNGGGEIRPPEAVPEPPAPAPAPEVAPEPVPAPPAPTPPPRPEPARTIPSTPTKPVPPPQKHPAATPASAPSRGSSTSAQPGSAAAAPAGLHPGTPGRPDGDTLALGSGQGLPSPMALWLSRVKFLVERNWRAPEGLTGVAAPPEVVFQVERDGRPTRVQLKTRSGNPTLDRLALRAVQVVESFPPIPESWPEDRVLVRYVLQYASR